ncbi:hypothetical protein L1987_21207 [Smallanthus sonchifolius]|uniref:Uncharacterized protein n=1 Tax=Smallanthus sonchifolius TaxID=185202 RepID=A0ACB9IUY4_9ASTR|nr:hypothetical protein L1987_21207 [Smallanthus sonchifolius]
MEAQEGYCSIVHLNPNRSLIVSRRSSSILIIHLLRSPACRSSSAPVGRPAAHLHLLRLAVFEGTKYITSNTYLDSISCVDTILRECTLSNDEELRKMATSMMTKFNKYWGNVKKFNLLVFIASLFDPRTKVD